MKHFPGGPGLAGTRMSILDFVEAKDDGGGEWWQLELWDMQSSNQIITTNKPTPSFFRGQMPFLSPNQ